MSEYCSFNVQPHQNNNAPKSSFQGHLDQICGNPEYEAKVCQNAESVECVAYKAGCEMHKMRHNPFELYQMPYASVAAPAPAPAPAAAPAEPAAAPAEPAAAPAEAVENAEEVVEAAEEEVAAVEAAVAEAAEAEAVVEAEAVAAAEPAANKPSIIDAFTNALKF